LDNNLVRCLIEDQGGMNVEFSATNLFGGRENCMYLPYFRSIDVSVEADENKDFWKNNPLWYQMGGSCFSFPNYGPACTVGGEEISCGGITAASCWTLERYGTDSKSGGVWMLSSIKNRMKRYVVRKLDLLLPGQNVHYTAVNVSNNNDSPLVGNAAWRNLVGSPFLEMGCEINACAKTWMTEPDWRNESIGHHNFANGIQFDDMSAIPTQSGHTVDYTVVPGPNGCTDFISGRVPRDLAMGWTSVINPRQQMLFFTFFPGPAALEENDMPINFNNFLFDYGGLNDTPFAFYDGGTSQSYSVGCGSGTNILSLGLAESIGKPTLMGVDTLVTIPSGENRTMYYASVFQPYENARLGLNFYSVEEDGEGIIIKRTKSWAFIAADTRFVAIRKLFKELNGEKTVSDTGSSPQ